MRTVINFILSNLRASRALTVLSFLCATSSSAYQIPAPFWTPKIDSALSIRDHYYRTIFQDTINFSIADLNKIQLNELCARLQGAPDSLNPWYNFFLGILDCNKEKNDSSGYFATALSLAQQDPGTTWVLFIEFTRNQKTLWAERCLLRLEKLLLASGAQSAPIIAQQLLFYAHLNEKQKDYKSAFNYYGWAERFDRNQPWSLLHRMWKCLPSHFQLFVSTFNELTKLVNNSWILQLYLAMQAYTWIHYFLFTFVFVVFVGTGLRHLPQAIHSLSDRLPYDTPSPLKSLLPLCLTLSFVSFGVIPFLWLIIFLIWRFTDNKEKTFLCISLFMLLCSPVDARVRDMFRQALMPQGSLNLYIRASEEGYSPELYRRSLEKVVIDRSDFLSCVTASLCAMKKDDTAAACINANNALSLRPNDPLALLCAGNALYLSNDFKKASINYQKIFSRFPGQLDARFNLAQCYARKSDTSIDLDFIKILSIKDQNAINNFININDTYFSKNWPPLRQIMPPLTPPSYFWKNIFPSYNGSWQTAINIWGASFLGFPPYPSMIAFIILTLIFILLNIYLVFKKSGQYNSTCRLCKRAICENCKKGELCPSCFRATKSIRNVKMLASLQTAIIQKRQAYHAFAEHLLDIFFPGSGMLFSNKHSMALAAFIIILTSSVYASYFFLSNIHSGYPLMIIFDKIEVAPYFLGFYNVFFIIRALSAAFRKKESILA
jgi:tetratricopeptide (TPR) repeat protein